MTTPPDTAKHDRMLDRVAKLLRQAEDAEKAGRDAERIAFQERAFEIMAVYGIDEALARAKQDGLDGKVDAKAASIRITMEGKYKPMQAVLLGQVARAMHCKPLQLGTQGRITLRIYGMPDHLKRLQDIWSLLIPQALWGLTNAEPPFGYSHSGELRVYRRNWLAGFASQVESRIYKAENAAAAAAGALVLYKSDKERAEIALAEDYPKTSTIKSRRYYDSSGYTQGALAGQSANIHRSLS